MVYLPMALATIIICLIFMIITLREISKKLTTLVTNQECLIDAKRETQTEDNQKNFECRLQGVEVKALSPKAALIFIDGLGESWFPLSQIKDPHNLKKGIPIDIDITEWLWGKMGLSSCIEMNKEGESYYE